MRKFILAEFLSLDGVMQGPGGPDEDPSGDMVRQALAAGLVDELRLLIQPVVLGHGRRLFGDDAQPSTFTLADSTITPSGVLITRYARGGEVRTGSYAEVEQE